MNIQRARQDIQIAREHFPNIEAHPTLDGGFYVKAALQTSVGRVYVLSVTLANYPADMPRVTVLAPAVTHSKHMYTSGQLCYMHPSYWNPAKHDLRFTLAQAAVWLNKHEVYLQKGVWPGPGIAH